MEHLSRRRPWKGRRRKQFSAGLVRKTARNRTGTSRPAAAQAAHPPASRHGERTTTGKARRGGAREYDRRRNPPGSTDPLNTTQIVLGGNLLVPYGIPKWDIGMVRLSAVTPRGSYLTSCVPLVHIRPDEKTGYCLGDHARAAGLASPIDALTQLRAHCDPRSKVEAHFIDAYRSFLEGSGNAPASALAPIPQAHLYLDDPLYGDASATPEFMIKADFAFWTGIGFVVVEIDGGSHIGNPRHITKDRALRSSGVDVVHILNDEVLRWGSELFPRLLPQLI